jgi:hypothetical protein
MEGKPLRQGVDDRILGVLVGGGSQNMVICHSPLLVPKLWMLDDAGLLRL